MEVDNTAAAAARPTPETVRGELCIVRPVLEQDLAELAALTSESQVNFDWNLKPWTLQRLKKKFEDEKEPGLWSRRERWFTVTDHERRIGGLLLEEQQRDSKVDVLFHAALALPHRAEFLRDMLSTYMSYKLGWFNTARISTILLDVQLEEAALLEELGFALQLRCKECWLYLGEKHDMLVYAWIPEWVMAARSPECIGV